MRAPGPRRPCRACVLLNHRKETTAEPARENFDTGRGPRDGLDLAAAGRADARRHARVGRRGDVPRASAARSNEGGWVLAARLASASAFERCQPDTVSESGAC